VLGYAGRNPAMFGGWDVLVARRVRRRGRLPVRNDGGVPRGTIPEPVATKTGTRQILIVVHPFESAAQLICYGQRCRARPRESRAALIKLAEETLARGDRDAYV
jgi:hypothetical protein